MRSLTDTEAGMAISPRDVEQRLEIEQLNPDCDPAGTWLTNMFEEVLSAAIICDVHLFLAQKYTVIISDQSLLQQLACVTKKLRGKVLANLRRRFRRAGWARVDVCYSPERLMLLLQPPATLTIQTD